LTFATRTRPKPDKEQSMRKTLAIAACVTILSVVGPLKAFGAANDCTGELGGMTIPVAGGNAPDLGPAPGVTPIVDAKTGPLYLDARHVGDDSTISVWLYQESDGLQGLQRGGHGLVPDSPAGSTQESCDESARFHGKHDQDIF
jgi:hypothetical protein